LKSKLLLPDEIRLQALITNEDQPIRKCSLYCR